MVVAPSRGADPDHRSIIAAVTVFAYPGARRFAIDSEPDMCLDHAI
jgi:hypothetical protein